MLKKIYLVFANNTDKLVNKIYIRVKVFFKNIIRVTYKQNMVGK